MPIHVTTSTTQSLSNKTFVDNLSTTGIVYADSGNSANWSSVYSTVQSSSADAWSYQGADVKTLTANWESVYTTVNSNSADYSSNYTTVNSNSANWSSHTDISLVATTSANWNSNYTTVNSNSANWNYQGTDIKALSSNWQNTYTTVSYVSSNWDSVYSSFNSQSANNVSVYSTVQSNSATWEAGGAVTDTGVRALTANWDSTYTTVNTNSAIWTNDVYEEVWVGAGAMLSPTLSGAQSVTLPITGSGNATYIDAFNFDAAAIEYTQFSFLPPTNCNRATFKCQFSWTASTTGSASWNIQAISLNDSNSIDIAWGNAQEAIDYAAGATTFQITSATNTISPSGSTNSNSLMLFRAYRNVNSVSDTLAVDASLLGVRLQYMMNGGLSASW